MAPATFEVIPRERLLDLIDAPSLAPITLITAPAGYGKSTLMHQWVERHAPLACGWYQIHTEHNTLSAFHHHLWRAVDKATGKPEPEPETVTIERVIDRLGAQSGQIILVLDDYHLIENGLIHQALVQLVRNLPPLTHLFLLSRQVPDLPLARLRAYGHVRQVEKDDLAFTFDEVKQVFAGLQVSDELLFRVTRTSEGWIAGLQLMLMSVSSNDGPASDQLGQLVETMPEHRLLNEYIVEEVLDALPDDLRRFVLDTVVFDELEPAMCNAVLQIDGSERLLDRLEHAIVFVGRPGGVGHALVYHRLFAECVQGVRSRSGVYPCADELRLRAARWHQAQGNFEEAAEYAIAAEAWDEAATIISAFVPLDFAHTNVWDSMYWVERLPEAALWKHLPLFQSYIATLLGNGFIDKARPLLDTFLSTPGFTPTRQQQGWHATQRAYIAFVDGDRDEALYQSYRALGLLSADDTSWRLLAWTGIHRECYARGERALAQEALWQAKADHRRQPRESIYWHFLMSPDLSNDLAIRGDLFGAEALNRHFIELVPAPMKTSLGAFKLRLLCIYLEQERLDLAAVEVEDILAELRERKYLIWSSGALVAIANYYVATGDAERAWATLRHALEITRQHGGRELIRKAQSGIAHYWLQTGQDGLAQLWADTNPLSPHVIRAFGDVDPRTLRAQMLYRQDRPDAALTLLDESIGLARSIGNVAAEIPFLVWASVAARATGAQDAADAYLHRSLELGAAGRFSRVYASTDVDLRDAIRALLPTLSSAARDHASALVRVPGGGTLPLEDEPGSEELLTQREREVLAELVLGKSNREIGETLFITERTVKKHLANLFRKTGTSNRMALALWGRGPEI